MSLWKKKITEAPDEDTRLGLIMLKMGMVNEDQLTTALELHRVSGNKIGDTIRHVTFLDEDQLGLALWVQQQLRSDTPERGWDKILEHRNKASKRRADVVCSLLSTLELSHGT